MKIEGNKVLCVCFVCLLLWEADKHCFCQVIKVNIYSINQVDSKYLDLISCKWYLTSVVFLLKNIKPG